MLTFNDTEEKAVEKAIAALADMIPLETMQPPQSRTGFSGIGNKVAPTPGIKRRGRHIPYTIGIWRTLLPCRQSGAGIHKGANFESVWSMESESCQSSVASVICNLRKKIEPDSQKPHLCKNKFTLSSIDNYLLGLIT